jgi:hypothetical protein
VGLGTRGEQVYPGICRVWRREHSRKLAQTSRVRCREERCSVGKISSYTVWQRACMRWDGGPVNGDGELGQTAGKRGARRDATE